MTSRKPFVKISAWLLWRPPSPESYIYILTFLHYLFGAGSWLSKVLSPELQSLFYPKSKSTCNSHVVHVFFSWHCQYHNKTTYTFKIWPGQHVTKQNLSAHLPCSKASLLITQCGEGKDSIYLCFRNLFLEAISSGLQDPNSPTKESNLCPVQWKCRVLTAEPLENSWRFRNLNHQPSCSN